MICPNCGVDVEEKHSYCPLCLTPLWDEEGEQSEATTSSDTAPQGASVPSRGATASDAAALAPDAATGSPGEPGGASLSEPSGPVRHREDHAAPRRTRVRAELWLIEAFTLVAGVAALVVFAADFAFTSDVGWSRYPLAGIATIWLMGIAGATLVTRPVLFTTALLLIGGGLCFALDRFTGRPFWFLDIAAPIDAVLIVLGAAAMSLARRRRLRPLQIVSLVSFCLGIALVVTEAALRRYFTGELLVTWSVLGFACLTAVSVVVLYLHRSLQKRHRDIRRYLHL